MLFLGSEIGSSINCSTIGHAKRGAIDFVTEIRFSRFFQVSQNIGRDFWWSELPLANLYLHKVQTEKVVPRSIPMIFSTPDIFAPLRQAPSNKVR